MVGGNLRDIINKAKKRAFGGDKPAPVNPPNEEYINKALKKADDKEDEFNAEKGTVDVFLANGDTLNGLINGSTKKGSVQGKYMAYLEKKIRDAREHIKDLKNEDKFYRREFITDCCKLLVVCQSLFISFFVSCIVLILLSFLP